MASPQTASSLEPYPDVERMSDEQLRERLADLDRDIKEGREMRADALLLTRFEQTRRIVQAELARRNGIVQQKQGEFWPPLVTAAQLLELPPDPTRWIWDQTLPIGGCSVLVSKPKVGKSTFAVNLAICIARGVPFLGRPTQQSPVAYLSLDASLPEIAETFTRLGLRRTDPIFIHAGAAPKDAVRWIVQRVNENQVRFVTVDTLQRLFRFQDLNQYSEVTNTMEPLLDAMRKQNCHVLFAHHAKKDAGDDLDSAIGSTAIRGLAYAYLHLKRLPESERRILRSDQRGGKNIGEMAIGFNRTTGWLELRGTMEDAEIEEAGPKIIEFLEEQEGVTEREILRALNIRAIIISKALRRMFQSNDIERQGKGRKGDPFRYSLPRSLSFSSEKGVIGGKSTGRETPITEKHSENPGQMLFPKKPEDNGKSTEDFEGWEEIT